MAELIGTTALKFSNGFAKILPSLGVVLGYGLALYLLSVSIQDLPVGVVYGTWAALGIVGAGIVGVVLFDETIDVAAILGFVLIIAGVYVLNVVSKISVN